LALGLAAVGASCAKADAGMAAATRSKANRLNMWTFLKSKRTLKALLY
jgi:hypothetical protein